MVGAEVTIVRHNTGDRRVLTTDPAGSYRVPLLTPDTYQVAIAARGFQTVQFADVKVNVTETTTIDVELTPAALVESVTVSATAPVARTGGPQLGRVVDARAVSTLPLATRNVTQMLALSPGAVTSLPDNTGVGRNTQTISVNGARVTQNNFEIDGVDVNTMGSSGAVTLPIPAPESIEEFKVQTSLYDATFGRAGGANIQVLHQERYERLPRRRVRVFPARCAQCQQPVPESCCDRATHAQTQRVRRNARRSRQARQDVVLPLVSRHARSEWRLQSEQHLLRRPHRTRPDERSQCRRVGRALHRARWRERSPSHGRGPSPGHIANGQFVIPTPQATGRYSGSAVSRFREDQFNANLDHRLGGDNRLSTRVFAANTPSSLALPSFRGAGSNVPGFGFDQANDNRLIVVQDVHAFSASLFNEARIGYAANRNSIVPQEPVRDSDVGINRSTAQAFPGLPLIRIAASAGGIVIGTPTNVTSAFPSVLTVADTLSIQRDQQTIRIGAEIRYNRSRPRRTISREARSISRTSRVFFPAGARSRSWAVASAIATSAPRTTTSLRRMTGGRRQS